MAQSLTFFQTTFMDILDEMDKCSWLFSKNRPSDFSRKLKLGFKKTLSMILSLGSKSIPNELLDYFQCAQDIPSASAFVQSRNKLLQMCIRDRYISGPGPGRSQRKCDGRWKDIRNGL